MILLTMIARVSDGLPLAASMQDDEQVDRDLHHYQSQAKQLFKRMNQQSPPRHSLETGDYIFHYIIERGVVVLCLCDHNFSPRLAFAYLDDLQLEFMSQFSSKVDSATRPYPFIEFDTYMQKARKTYIDSRARHKLSQISAELREIHSQAVQNVEDVLQRGEALSALDDKAHNLSTLSKKYKKDARYLNLRSSYAKIAAVVTIVVLLFLIIYWLWLR